MPWIVLDPLTDVPGGASDRVVLRVLQDAADVPGWPALPVREVDTVEVPASGLADAVAGYEQGGDQPRWVLDETAARYPALLAAGVRLERCHDLRLSHAILRMSAAAGGSALASAPPGVWDRPHAPEPDVARATRPAEAAMEPSLFDAWGDAPDASPALPVGRPGSASLDVLAELEAQLTAVAGAADPGRLRLLLAAESTGALIAVEIAHEGVPWDVAEHDRVLTAMLGPRPAPGRRPSVLDELAGEIALALDAPGLNPDSQPHLLAALRRAGLEVSSTSRYEIGAQHHPVVEPLLRYKKLARLLSANGWSWLDTWVHDGRYRPDYVVGGVVTGRWASRGSGALQLPAQIRSAVRADPGWLLVVADAAQLEPRVLAAMAGDAAMAAAARGADLYQGLVDAGAVGTRKEAKIGMLGAIYGGTTGVSAAVMPRLTRAFPQAIGLVEAAARAGERGEVVSTWLGRSSPRPGESWWAARAAGAGEGADPGEVAEARRRARDWGRFTRNFVVQGTAAEWALCWLAALRRRLWALALERECVDGERPQLVFFLHDEVMVHTPAALAEQVAVAVRDAAAEAGRLVFGQVGVEFPLDVSVVDAYDQAS